MARLPFGGVSGEYEESFSLDALFTAVLMDKHETFLDREIPVSVMPPVRWLPSQEDLLLQAVAECGKNWVKIAKRVGDPRLTAEHCRQRFSSFKRTVGPWEPAEDARLVNAVRKFGNNWSAVAACLPGRNGK